MTNNEQRTTSNGFTIIEVLLALSLLTAVAGAAVPLYTGFLQRTGVETAADTYAAAVRQARTRAAAGFRDTDWSVRVQIDEIIVYSGADFAGRDTARDVTISVSAVDTVSGVTDVTFAQKTGLPDTTGTTTFDTGIASRSRHINTYGTLSF